MAIDRWDVIGLGGEHSQIRSALSSLSESNQFADVEILQSLLHSITLSIPAIAREAFANAELLSLPMYTTYDESM